MRIYEAFSELRHRNEVTLKNKLFLYDIIIRVENYLPKIHYILDGEDINCEDIDNKLFCAMLQNEKWNMCSSAMKISAAGIDIIRKFEGCKLQSYYCPAGVLTIGYGHTKGVTQGMTITQEQADAFLLDDLAETENAVNSAVRVPLTQNQFDALTSLVYNIGAGNFRKSTLLKLLNRQEYDSAAEQFKKWIYANKQVSKGLKNRRDAEYELFQRK